MGRPTDLTDELLTRLKAAFAKGLTRDEVAAEAGVSRASLYRWIADGVLETTGEVAQPILNELRRACQNGSAVLFYPDNEYRRRCAELAEAAKLDRMTLRDRRRRAGRARFGR